MIEETTTRRLPSWMMLGGAATGASAAATADPVKQRKKKKKKKDDPKEEEEEKENSNSLRDSRFSLRKCQSKRITSSKEIPPFTENEDSVPSNKKVYRKRKPKAAAPLESRHDDSVLTVEDLVSIAEEYVQGNELSNHKHSTHKEHELRIDLPTTDSAMNHCQRSLVAHEKKDRSSFGEKFVSFSRSGHPAQDMLDLLLGPLLNKPTVKEKKPEFIPENIAFFHNLENQSRNGIGEEIVPPVKKKASLKSKKWLIWDVKICSRFYQ